MWNLVRYGAIVRMLVCYAPRLVARAEVEAGASNNLAPPAQPSPGVTFNNTPEQVRAVAEDALQLLAIVGHARVSAPDMRACGRDTLAEVYTRVRLVEQPAHGEYPNTAAAGCNLREGPPTSGGPSVPPFRARNG